MERVRYLERSERLTNTTKTRLMVRAGLKASANFSSLYSKPTIWKTMRVPTLDSKINLVAIKADPSPTKKHRLVQTFTKRKSKVKTRLCTRAGSRCRKSPPLMWCLRLRSAKVLLTKKPCTRSCTTILSLTICATESSFRPSAPHLKRT